MLEQIAQLVQQFGQKQVVENPEVPNELNSQVMEEATHTITGGFQNALSSGNLQGIMSLFGGGGATGLLSHPLVGGLVEKLTGNLVSKFNLSPETAGSVASKLIPGVLENMSQRTLSDKPEDASFNLNSLVSSLTGGSNAGSGGIDFQQLLHKFTGGGEGVSDEVAGEVGRQSNEQQKSGGLTGLISGFFK